MPYPRDRAITSVFSSVVAAQPAAVAIRASDETLTYAALDARRRAMSVELRACGVRPGDRVAILLERSAAHVVAQLGVLTCGAAYVPIDPATPPSRRAILFAEAGAHVAITDVADLPLPAGVHRVVVDVAIGHGPTRPGDPDAEGDLAIDAMSAAYVMFTSGTTGRPKGVVVPHRAVLRLALSADYVPLGPGAVVLGYAPAAFDATTFETWGALLTGGTLAIAPPGVLSLDELAAHVEREQCTVAWLTAGVFHAMADAAALVRLGTLRCLLTGGDVVSPDAVRRVMARWPALTVVNGYGPTENTTFTAVHVLRPGEAVPTPLPIGRPIANGVVRVVRDDGDAATDGDVGELWAGGDGLALGYLRAADDAGRFVADAEGERWYRTGDRARWAPDGVLEFLGRLDAQVKIRGHRVEPGDTEAWLRTCAGVSDAAVVVTGEDARRMLAAAVTAVVPTLDIDAMLQAAREALPEPQVPGVIVRVPHLPLTPQGKVDRRRVAEMLAAATARAGEQRSIVPTRGPVEAAIAAAFASVLGLSEVGATDHFFALGGNSLLAMQLVDRLLREHHLAVPIVDVFQYPTPAALAASIGAPQDPQPRAPRPVQPTLAGDDGIAIVGMAGRFPGVGDVDGLWRAVLDGQDAGDLQRAKGEPVGRLPGIERFAARAFGVPPAQAALLDPQVRLLLETAWGALEHAGHVPESFTGDIGVYAGVNHNGYFLHHVWPRRDLRDAHGALGLQFGNEKDYAAITLAHRLDLTGPAVSVHTACSTALVAVAQACDALRSGGCDLALAGGASLLVPANTAPSAVDGGMLSPDGRTRPFDADASGTSFNDGAAVVVLRRLADAEADGDTIYAVIRGAAVNNDGARKASFTAPSVDGQAAVVARALAVARVEPASIGLVEAHGTATPIGDPIEVAALVRAFGPVPSGQCALGSVKGTIGHLTIAAGAAGLIKTALALHHRVLPPSAHFLRPNPALQLERTPFFVPRAPTPWPDGPAPRRAGVSAFGVGGTNAHVVLEEYRAPARRDTPQRWRVLPMSAPSAEGVETLLDEIAQVMRDSERDERFVVADAARTLGAGRRGWPHRAAIVARTSADVATAIAQHTSIRGRAAARPPRVAFLFPGQGAQWPGMGLGLATHEPRFAAAWQDVAATMRAVTGVDVDALRRGSAEQLSSTEVAQPVIFAWQVAMLRVLEAYGVRPDVVLGHSVGEFAAAVAAGLMSLDDAARVVLARGRLMASCPPGRMLAVGGSAEQVAPHLAPDVVIAGLNAPGQCVLSGPADAITECERRCAAAGLRVRGLATSHAFHSPAMDGILESFAVAVAPVTWSSPTATFVSSSLGRVADPREVATPAYWTRQLRDPVRFAEALEAVAQEPVLVVDLGPGTIATGLASATLEAGQVEGFVSLATVEGHDEGEAFARGLASAWVAGTPVGWAAMPDAALTRRIALPHTPLERERCWLDAPATADPWPGATDGTLDLPSLIARQQALLAAQLALVEGRA